MGIGRSCTVLNAKMLALTHVVFHTNWFLHKWTAPSAIVHFYSNYTSVLPSMSKPTLNPSKGKGPPSSGNTSKDLGLPPQHPYRYALVPLSVVMSSVIHSQKWVTDAQPWNPPSYHATLKEKVCPGLLDCAGVVGLRLGEYATVVIPMELWGIWPLPE